MKEQSNNGCHSTDTDCFSNPSGRHGRGSGVGSDGPGVKHDVDKPRMDLLDPDALEGVAKVLGFGAAKYTVHNWRNGIHYSRLIAAAYRHLGAINRGEDVDPESGLRHVDHLGCCVMFLSWMGLHRPDLDDRWKQPYSHVLNKANE